MLLSIGAIDVCIQLAVVFIIFIWFLFTELSIHLHRFGLCWLLQILHLLMQPWLLIIWLLYTGAVQTLHVPALSWYILQIRLLAALLRQLLVQVGEEAHHSLVDLVIDLLLDSWSYWGMLIDLTIIEMVKLWWITSLVTLVASRVATLVLVTLRDVMTCVVQHLSWVYDLHSVGIKSIWTDAHLLIWRHIEVIWGWRSHASISFRLLLILVFNHLILGIRQPLRNISTKLLSYMIGLDGMLLCSKYVLIFLTGVEPTTWSSLVTDTTQTLRKVVSQVIVIHHMVQVINSLRGNRHRVILILQIQIRINILIHTLLHTNHRLSIKRKLALPVLSYLLIGEISSALFKLNINLLIGGIQRCLIQSLILAIEHLELLTDLAIAWELSLTIRILIDVLIGSPHFHLIFQHLIF